MRVEAKVRIVAGVLVLISFTLGRFVNPAWFWLAALVGVNLVQSAFTGFCPAETLFRSLSRKKN